MATLEKHATHKPAQTEREWWALLKSDNKHFIRSMEDWHAALKSNDNPLAGCDSRTVEEFTKSLRFNNGGLAHANYGGAAEMMSYTQFRNLWGRFGLGMGLFEDHNDMECVSKGSCGPATHFVCTSNC